MMKLGFSTLGCPDWDFEKVIGKAKEYGFSGLEIRGIQEESRADRLTPFLPENREKTKKLLRENGLVVTDYASSVTLNVSEKEWEGFYDEAVKTAEVCGAMEIPYIRVFGNFIGENEEAGIRNAADHAKEICKAASKYGVGILLEIHGDFNTADRILKVAELTGEDNFGIIWDIAHTEPSYGDRWEEFYEKIRPLIRHTHIKDSVRPYHTLCSVGEGSIPIRAIIGRLLKDGYDGWFSLEWEKKWHPELPDPESEFPHYIDYMRNLF